MKKTEAPLFRERVAFLVVTASIVFGVISQPGMDACRLATLMAAVTLAFLVLTRLMGERGAQFERAVLALFLGGMPVVYLLSGWSQGLGLPGVECAGLVIFGGLAILGLKGSPWFLAFGIAAHGLGWDAWHYHWSPSVVPDWYARGCLVADIGLALYVAARIPVLRRPKRGSLERVTFETAEHYRWGERCEGWHFLNSADLSLIREKMPPGTFERKHRHTWARQFFLILSGAVEIETDGKTLRLEATQGLEIPAGEPHQIFNRSSGDVEFILVSSPHAHGDRIDLD